MHRDPSSAGQTLFARPALVGSLLIALAAVAAYAPILGNRFIWDDGVIISNPLLRSLTGLWHIWAHPLSNPIEQHYWPFTYTIFWLEYHAWGVIPAGHHAASLVLHIANSLLAWRLLRQLEVRGSWLAALLFAVHPVHVESVAWAVEMKDLLSGALYLGAAITFFGSENARSREHKWKGQYALALTCFVLSMLSKSVTVTFPLAVLVVCWWRNGSITRRQLTMVTPFIVLALAYTWLDLTVVAHFPLSPDATPLSLGERLLLPGHALTAYTGKLVWPLHLSSFYVKWKVSPASPDPWLHCLAWAAGLALLWMLRARIGRGPFAAAAFYVICLSPTLGVISFKFLNHAYVADRFQYLAILGPLALLASLLDRKPATIVLGVALALVLGLLSREETRKYRNPETYFMAAVESNPKAWMARYLLGESLVYRGAVEPALPYYVTSFWGGMAERTDLDGPAEVERIVAKYPTNPSAYFNAGLTYASLGDLEMARKRLGRALTLAPQLAATRVALAAVEARCGNTSEAISLLRPLVPARH